MNVYKIKKVHSPSDPNHAYLVGVFYDPYKFCKNGYIITPEAMREAIEVYEQKDNNCGTFGDNNHFNIDGLSSDISHKVTDIFEGSNGLFYMEVMVLNTSKGRLLLDAYDICDLGFRCKFLFVPTANKIIDELEIDSFDIITIKDMEQEKKEEWW